MTVSPDRLAANVARHRAVLNRLEPHLGCVTCRGPLTDGVCPRCDPPACPVCLQAPCVPDRPTCADFGCVQVDDERARSIEADRELDRARDEGMVG